MKALSIIVFLILFIFACTLPSADQEQGRDPNAVFTAAAETASVQLTRAAISSPKTATSPPVLALPTLTPSPIAPQSTIKPTEDNCDKAKFLTDVTVPDGTEFAPGETFTKTWRVRNIGTCTWTADYALVFDNGKQMSGASPQLLMGSVAPGNTVDISVNLTAPATDGDYTGNWQIRNSSNVLFAKIYVQIKVKTAPSPAFAVTSVNYSVSTWDSAGHVNCPKVTANITTNGAGTVKYHWLRSDGSSSTTKTLNFGSAGTQSVEYKWALGSGAVGSFWVGIYIDDPNHQDFGHTTVTKCTIP